MPFGVAAAAIGAGVAIAGSVVSANASSKAADKQIKYAEDHNFANSSAYDASKFQYGGGPGQADKAADEYNTLGSNAQYRTAQAANYSAANQYATQGDADAGGQRQAAGLMMARANGSVPSIAQMQADRQIQQNVAAQASQAASARGAAGLALAGQTAATNTANGTAAISSQAQINAGQERLQAEQAAGGAYGNLRQGDLGAQGQAAQQSQFNAQLTAQQRAQNDQFQLAQQQNAIGVQNSQLQAGIAQQGMLSGNQQATNNAVGNIQSQNAANQQAAISRAATGVGQSIQMGGSMMGGASAAAPKTDSSTSNSNNVNATAGQTSGGQAYALPREKGGPVTPGQPYLVGEKGPELVVPSQPAMVVPNRLSQALSHSYPAPAASVPLAAPEGKELHQSLDGHAFYNDAHPATDPVASSAPSKGDAPPALMARKKVATPSQARKMTPDELMAAADREIASVKADTARRSAEGPAIRRMADGTAANGYNTELTQGAEQAYRAKFGENSDRDYDLRGAFAAGLTDGAKTARAPDGSAYFPDHLPDTYKKPNHETFSDESQYAPMAPDRAGHWQGDRFTPPAPAPQPTAAPAPIPGATPPTPQQQQMLHALLGTMTPEQMQMLGRGLLTPRRPA